MAHILVVEDERDIRDLIAFTLKFGGHQVTTAPNGEDAVRLTRQAQPDLVLSDIRMPKMNGLDACRAIKADPATRHIPVVFLSAKGQPAEVQAGLAAGAVEYLVKPFAPDQLTRAIDAVLARNNSA